MAKPIRHRIVGKMVAKRLGMTRRQEQPRVSSMLQYGSVASQIDNNKTSLDSPANLRTNPFTRSEEGSRLRQLTDLCLRAITIERSG